MSEEVLYNLDGHIATITLNAPHRLNTISGSMLKGLTEALYKANRDKQVYVVILTGAGDRAFCAGMDLSQSSDDTNIASASSVSTNIDLSNTPPTVLHQMDKPVICAINGSAAGYGLELIFGCDIRIMSDKAKMAMSFVKRGILPESGGTWLLPKLVGWEKASRLFFLGRTLLADEVLKEGLVSEVVPADQVMPTACALALEIGANAPLAVQASKNMMR
jgi:enoyl-CoA hydratase/carnithine racemase